MSRVRDFAQVDVFSATPYLGNPVAVVLDGAGLDDEAMGRVARWTNLSETTFVLPPTSPGSDYRLRIFTPGGELPFAGHPTLGSAHAWLEHGGSPQRDDRVVQECGAGLVEVRRGDGLLSFAAPPVRRTGDLEDEYLEQIVKAFGIGRDQAPPPTTGCPKAPGWAGPATSRSPPTPTAPCGSAAQQPPASAAPPPCNTAHSDRLLGLWVLVGGPDCVEGRWF